MTITTNQVPHTKDTIIKLEKRRKTHTCSATEEFCVYLKKLLPLVLLFFLGRKRKDRHAKKDNKKNKKRGKEKKIKGKLRGKKKPECKRASQKVAFPF